MSVLSPVGPGGRCLECTTTSSTPSWTLEKTSDPASGATIASGGTITYTLTATNTSSVPVTGATAVDDLSGVLAGADVTATSDELTRDGTTLTWAVPTLAPGQTRTVTYTARVRGHGGHSSRADVQPAPIVTMARLAIALYDLGVARKDAGPDGMRGLCMNVAGIDGGVAFNVIPEEAALTFSIRPAPGFDRAAWEATLAAAIAAIDPAIALTCEIDHAPFGGGDDRGLAALVRPHVEALVPLDFWTEAALYQAAGKAAVVVGPGDIGCAHAADESVAIADLEWAVALCADVYAEAGRG